MYPVSGQLISARNPGAGVFPDVDFAGHGFVDEGGTVFFDERDFISM